MIRVLVILCALQALVLIVLLFFYYRSAVRPMRAIVNGMNLLKAQDFSSRLKKIGQSNADEIVELFNRLMEQLKEERLKLREQNEFLDLLVHASPLGVVVLDYDDRVVQINPAGQKILGVSSGYEGESLRAFSLHSAFDISTVPLKGTDTFYRTDGSIFKVSHAAFVDRGFKRSFYLIEHLTEEVRRAERKAYEKVIRMMAHEVNNSVAGITSILDTSTQILRDEEPELAEALGVCLERCYSMSNFVSRFADVVKVPKVERKLIDLNQLLRDQQSLFESLCGAKQITIEYQLDPEVGELLLDAPLMEQVIINIVKNAIESIPAEGRVLICTSAQERVLEVIDNGVGIPKEVETKLFSPFFSTKPQGQGIGLLFIQEVLIQHGFSYSLRTDSETSLTHFTLGW
ncbi:sensor histidine kinase [Porphyromonas levii]|uniref:sensor histidine kinase n=1 Tax=Porphyromonas levii TaxID=28114 RepID=UPI001BAE40D2|nr:ATP-binding protein [Porphyromonas levii]MBR8764750.1 Signal transduction histidine-protein kinase AtoS [Porphyromonas levii]MBR8803104.1 Signal transduction histidine-protein kinase AtoS [Porphyromonas levii]